MVSSVYNNAKRYKTIENDKRLKKKDCTGKTSRQQADETGGGASMWWVGLTVH